MQEEQEDIVQLTFVSQHEELTFINYRGKRPIHTSTAGRGPDQYMNSGPVQKHTSTTFLFKIHTSPNTLRSIHT